MKAITIPLFLFSLGALFLSSIGSARHVENWTYERLFEEADLVVIGYVKSFSASREKWPEKIFEKDRFEGVNTVFGAKSVLKGTPPPGIDVIHFKYKQGAQPYNDGPGLVSFFHRPVSIEVRQTEEESGTSKESLQLRENRISKPEYLLFLGKRENGKYEPVSGQMDAAESVRILASPGLLR